MDHLTPENVAQTVAKIMETGGTADVFTPTDLNRAVTEPLLISVPEGRSIQDMTATLRKSQEVMKPHARKGTAKLTTLQSLIEWALRFKGENSVLFAMNDGDAPSMTCIADYHLAGPATVDPTGDPLARHGHHRASYTFPLSKQWRAWMKISGTSMTGIEMGVFLEDNILDVIDPPQALTSPAVAGSEASEAELRLIDIARRLDGKFGNASQLLDMAKSFTVNESAEYTVSHNSTTGEATVMTKSEHIDGTGQPIKPPKLFLIAIPVFENGPAYRLPVRFQYRKAGPTVKFVLTIHDPKHAKDHAFDEAVQHAAGETGLTVLMGSPEA